MADTSSQSSAAAAQGSPQTTAKVKREKKVKNPKSKPSHPPTSEMVVGAIKGLKERGGSSLQAIKKYVAANYKVEADKVAPFIKKYLKTAVASGSLVQTKGKGASGSFKLASAQIGEKKKSSPGKGKKSGSNDKPKTTTVKKSPAAGKLKKEKKSASVSKAKKESASAAAKKKLAAASKSKSPSKAKKSKPGPTKKPKAPIPKTAKSGASASKGAKKTATKKSK